jgi:hypothetical protein
MIFLLAFLSLLIGGIYLIWVQEIRFEKMGKGGNSGKNYDRAMNTPREAFFIALAIFLFGLLLIFLTQYYGVKVGPYDI